MGYWGGRGEVGLFRYWGGRGEVGLFRYWGGGGVRWVCSDIGGEG